MKSAKDHDGYDPAADEEILQKLRDEVKAIKTSTTFLDSQKAIEKELAAAKAEGREPNLEGLETSENLNVMDVALKQAMEKAGFVENSDQSLDTPEEDSVENEEFTNDLQTLFDSPEEAQSMGAAAVSPEEGPSETTEGLEAAPTSEEDAAEHVLPDEAAPQMEIDEETAQFEAIYGLTSKDEQADLEGR